MVAEILVVGDNVAFDNQELGISVYLCLHNFPAIKTQCDLTVTIDTIDNRILDIIDGVDVVFIDDSDTLFGVNPKLGNALVAYLSNCEKRAYFITKVQSEKESPHNRNLLLASSSRIYINNNGKISKK